MAASYENLPDAERSQLDVGVPNGRDILKHLGPLDATLPPTPIRELLAASGATLFVLATDPALIATIRRAADQHPLFVVETWADLIEAVESGRCGIALLDAAVLGSRVPRCLAALSLYSDRLVTLVAADRAAAQDYVAFLSDGRIHRLLIKPAAIGATRLLVESATARRLQLREETANDDAPSVAVAASSPPLKWHWAAVAAAAAAAGASVVAWFAVAIVGGRLGWWDRVGATEPVAAPTATAVPAAVPTHEDALADHRAKAALARQEGRLAEPLRDNALDHYVAILALAPQDADARSGVSSVVEILFTRAEEALLADSLQAAAAALDHVRRVDPASSRLAFLDAQLARSLAALPAPPPANTAPTPAVAVPTELDSVLSLATARLRRGQLLRPAGDSATAYVERATELARDDPRVRVLRNDLAAALIAAARLVFDSDMAAAANLATEARRLGVESAALVALEREVGSANALTREEQQLSERLDTARARVQSGALFAPAGDSALDYLRGLQGEAPQLAGLAEAWEVFRQTGVLAIQNAIESGDWATADAQLAGLAQAPGGAPAATALAAELAARRLQQLYLATAAPASELTVRSSAPAVYPPGALERGTEGWVDLEFVVDRAGQPQNLVVQRASSPGLFDAAALAAVGQYRYAPFEHDGRVYERRVGLRVRFQLQFRRGAG